MLTYWLGLQSGSAVPFAAVPFPPSAADGGSTAPQSNRVRLSGWQATDVIWAGSPRGGPHCVTLPPTVAAENLSAPAELEGRSL